MDRGAAEMLEREENGGDIGEADASDSCVLASLGHVHRGKGGGQVGDGGTIGGSERREADYWRRLQCKLG